MNILIIGDSWGVPNYLGPPGVEPKYHTEYLLHELGHTVYNCAINGGSNLESINRARDILKSTSVPMDWIIWFHTESLRDRHLFDTNHRYYIDQIIDQSSKIIYEEFKMLQEIAKAKTFVIGGQAKLTESFYAFVKPNHVIPDWRSEILKKEFPLVHSLCHLDLIEKSSDSIEHKNKLLAQHELILDCMKRSEDFPDNCHPGIIPHKNLVKTFAALIV